MFVTWGSLDNDNTFIGCSWTNALAHEVALKTRASSQFWAEVYPALDYRHGPLAISHPELAVWAFGADWMLITHEVYPAP